MTDVIGYHHLTPLAERLIGPLVVAGEGEGHTAARRPQAGPASLGVFDLSKSTEWYSGKAFALDLGSDVEAQHPPGMDHVALQVASAHEVRTLKDRFAQLGVEHSEVKESNGNAMITLRDPDNIQIEVFGGKLDPSIAGGRTGA